MRMDELNARILEGLSGEAREGFIEGLKVLGMSDPVGREALRESIRRARPDFTEAQVDIFVGGEAKPELDLEESFVRLGLTHEQAKIAAKGDVRGLGPTKPIHGGDRGALEDSFRCAHPEWTEAAIKAACDGRVGPLPWLP